MTLAQRDFVEAYRQGLGPRAAARLPDETLRRDALAVAARVEAEIEQMQRMGALKSVNRAYRDYRLAASARGERVLPYAQWMTRYKGWPDPRHRGESSLTLCESSARDLHAGSKSRF